LLIVPETRPTFFLDVVHLTLEALEGSPGSRVLMTTRDEVGNIIYDVMAAQGTYLARIL
jgi:hypothetical protein